MGVFEQFPYTNFHDLNLDWILKAFRELENEVTNFVSINAIKYADPLRWDITRQYEKNTVVLDNDGNAFLSVQPVPSGVNLDRAEYWTNIGNFSALWENVKSAIAVPDEGHSTTASAAREQNTLVWVDGKLLEVTKAMYAGDRYDTEEGGNSRLYTMQMLMDALLAEVHDRENNFVMLTANIENEETQRKAADATLETTISQETNTRENAVDALNGSLAQEIVERKAADLAITEKFAFNETVANVYVSTYGNDNNNGLSAEKPMKTIPAVYRKYANHTYINIHFITSGNYDINNVDDTDYRAYIGGHCTVFIGLAADVVINGYLYWFGGHIEFWNVIVNARLDIRSSSIVLKNSAFNGEIYFNNSNINTIESNTVNSTINLSGSKFICNGVTFNETSSDRVKIVATNSIVFFQGNNTVNTNIANMTSAFIRCYNGDITFQSIPAFSGKYDNVLWLNISRANIINGAITTFDAASNTRGINAFNNSTINNEIGNAHGTAIQTLTATVNLNSYRNAGSYYVKAGATNAPADVTNDFRLDIYDIGNGFVEQTAIPQSATPIIHRRMYNGSAWSSWT